MSISPKGATFAVLPGLAALALHYSLPIHMHHSLGGWPPSIGVRGFSPALLFNLHLVERMFHFMAGLSLFVALLLVASLVVKRWRRFAVYFALYETTVLLCFVLAEFVAPAGFLSWWRD